VTGSSTGIGRACALRLDSMGFDVFAGVRKESDGDSLRSEASGRLEPVIVDVADEATIEAAAERIREATSGRIAGVVNNAGIAVAGPIEGLSSDDWRRQFEVNVFGQVAVTRALLPMIRAADGRVVFMSSIGGRGSLPFAAPYNSSKHAIEAIGDSLRMELRDTGVDVSIVEPGAIATPIWEKGDADAVGTRERMGSELEGLYGKRLDDFQALAKKTGANGIEPEKVADAVAHALTADRPKTRYVVGRVGKAMVALERWLPDRVFDRLVARAMRG
jgi:NAD(P)-dependent dehydrogenase (short-subunit alcohol dehydrogenase family)